VGWCRGDGTGAFRAGGVQGVRSVTFPGTLPPTAPQGETGEPDAEEREDD